jgi:hypothetical protein
MKKLIILFTLSLGLLTYDVYTQSITWQKTYHVFPNDFGYKILPAPDNCFYFAGTIDNVITSYSYILKIDQFGDTLWSRQIPGGTLTAASSSDGGCVFLTFIDSLSSIKLDSNGNIVWQKYFAGGGEIWDLIRTSDNGFIACGNAGLSAQVYRLDSNGNFIWHRIYSGGSRKKFNSVVEENVNSFVLTGYLDIRPVTDSTKVIVTKIDSSGNLIWEKPYNIEKDAFAVKIKKIDNGFVVGGDANLSVHKTFILKVDTSGILLQTKIWNPYGTSQEFFDDISYFNANKIIVSKRVDSSSSLYTYAKAQLIDSNFNLIKEQVYYPSYSYAIFSSILPLPNKDILFAGTFDYYTNWIERRYDFYAVRTDSLLNTSPFPPIGIANNNQNLPDKYILHQNYPNPFNPTTNIKFSIPERSLVTVKIYNILGSEIKTLLNEDLPAGNYQAQWDASGSASGIYFVVMQSGAVKLTKKMALLK